VCNLVQRFRVQRGTIENDMIGHGFISSWD
jgi:hypothetical protein